MVSARPTSRFRQSALGAMAAMGGESRPKWENKFVRHIVGSLIRRDANEPRESLPVAWMWAVPASADVRGVRLGDAEG